MAHLLPAKTETNMQDPTEEVVNKMITDVSE
jgi:hypothetical protein